MPRAARLLAAALVVLLSGAALAARRGKSDDLVTIVTPGSRSTAVAHPHVNVLVHFGSTTSGIPADPSTFRARLGRDDITARFTPVVENGITTGVRATLAADEIRVGGRRANRLRLSVESVRTGKKVARDVDRVRFRAEEGANTPPVADVIPQADVVVPGVPFKLDARGSYDVDGDALTWSWDFGDGGTSAEEWPSHTFDAPEGGSVTVRLTVSDGQASTTAETTLPAVPPLPEGKEAGSLGVAADAALEFGALPVGQQATRTIHLTNSDTRDVSWIVVHVGVDDGAFGVTPTTLDIPPGETKDLTVTFAPTATGHAAGRVSLVAAASNRNALSFLAHGYGGSAPGSGPTFAGLPAFYTELSIAQSGFAVRNIAPDGTRGTTDNGVHVCQYNGSFSTDVCMSDADCAANGGTCPQSATCIGGTAAGQACSTYGDCPNGYCFAYFSFDPVDFCGDGQGGLYLLSEDGTWTDPNTNDEDEMSVSVLGLSIDENANTVGRLVLSRTTSETTQLACDGFAAADGGRVLLPEYRIVPDSGMCFSSDREALVGIRKSNGSKQTIMSRIDAVDGVGDCDYVDPATDLQTTRDGAATFATLESSGSTWRIRPTPLEFVNQPPFGTIWNEIPADGFRVHPDGSLLFVTATQGSSAGIVNLYRVNASMVADNPVPLSSLAPCATYKVPNNGDASHRGFTNVLAFAAAPPTLASRDGTVLVTFTSGSIGLSEVISSSLQVRGTLAFTAPADDTTCSVAGLIDLEAHEQLTF